MVCQIAFDKFWERADYSDNEGCWPWVGTVNSYGYGRVRAGGRMYQATHLSLEIDGRPRRNNLYALHSCDNTICVNPRHLRWGTAQDNMDDMHRRGRFVKSKRTNKKMNELIAADIIASSETQSVLAARHGISPTLVSRIRQKNGLKFPRGPRRLP